LSSLEHLLASICVSPNSVSQLHIFLDLQSSFETNGERHSIPRGRLPQAHTSVILRASRVTFSFFTCFLDPSLAQRPQYRERRRSPGLVWLLFLLFVNDHWFADSESVRALCRPMMQALAILQGTSLLHGPSKRFLARRWCIQVCNAERQKNVSHPIRSSYSLTSYYCQDTSQVQFPRSPRLPLPLSPLNQPQPPAKRLQARHLLHSLPQSLIPCCVYLLTLPKGCARLRKSAVWMQSFGH